VGIRGIDPTDIAWNSLRWWLPYRPTYSADANWWRPTVQLFGFILLEVALLLPVWPVVVRAPRSFRNGLAVLVVALAVVLWGPLERSLGTPPAAFVCAAALVAALWLTTERAYVGVGALVCAAFLATSAFAVQPPPSGVLDRFQHTAPAVGFSIRPPRGTAIDTSDLSLSLAVFPRASTPFGCPRRAHLILSAHLPYPETKATRAAAELLRRSDYLVTVSRRTRIAASPGASGTSRVVHDSRGLRATYTVWSGKGFDAAIAGTDFDFDLPVQTVRETGSCFVVIPELSTSDASSVIPPDYFQEPTDRFATLFLPQSSDVDLSRTRPAPEKSLDQQSSLRWNCTSGSSDGCPAVAVVVANWSDPYKQVALILVGALIAIAAEQGLTRHRA
jgi:hypothetical protein